MTEPFVVTLAPERARDGHQTYEVTKAGMGRMGYLQWSFTSGQYVFANVGMVHFDILTLIHLAGMCCDLTAKDKGL